MLANLRLSRRPLALLLDAGDTLIFFDAVAVSAELASLGLEVSAARLEQALHAAKRAYQQHLQSGSHDDGWTVLMLRLLELAGVSTADAQRNMPALRRAHDAFYFWRKVPPDLPAALMRAARARLRLGIVSNSEGRLRSVLERVGLADKFELIIDSHLEGLEKPDAAIFRLAVQRLGVPSERVVYAGDIPEVDVLGSERAGLHGVLVDAFDGYRDRAELVRVRSVAELVDALLELPE
jgi:putative hydrolase of the HAD superfamily